jgi:hypothetical protein
MRFKSAWVAAIVCLHSVAAAASPLVVGILEQRPSRDSGSPLQYDLRPAFVKAGADWTAAPAPGSKTTWSVYFQGKFLGTVASTTPIKSDMAHAGTFHIAAGNVPGIGSPTKEFGGWLDARSHRPLVALNAAPASLASHWTKDQAHPELLGDAGPEFRKLVPSVGLCNKDGDDAGTHTVRASDIRALPGWQSSSGEKLLHFETDSALETHCEIKDVTDLWFIRDEAGHIKALPGQVWNGGTNAEFTADMTFVDSGTFDGAGDEEAIFFLSGYDLDGYVLYYDHFQKFARLTWGYH